MFAGIRSRALVTTAALALACGGLLAPATAHADTSLLSCTGTQTVTYDPPLTDTAKSTKVTITEVYTSCKDTAGITSGKGTLQLTETASCTSLNNPLGTQDQPTYQWNNDKKSTVLFKVTSVDRLGNGTSQVTAAGTVTDGFGKGSAATRTVTLPDLSLTACEGKGVPGQSGPATLTFA
ncbi:hypothetical protein GCM10010211_75960 [Streptomyces albospinus]|uniref:Uncharacterized protein n=1 Tax=Streptomyces albospinus TaxID=285515 RepID=A0ABQ2VQF7_9ACTN|nr:hypothetical protein [Streptomyces albospinus]GGU97466.1 hypothetical protein GCM10010211_75960 [Streptomyces albospinus]